MNEKYLIFDTETTGVDTSEDRVVQLFIGLADEGGNLVESYEWVINPGVEVPQGASDIHGFTTEFLEENGVSPEQALSESREVFLEWSHLIVVAFNLQFDLSLLDEEFKRHGVSESFGSWMSGNARLFDPLVVDRAQDKYRKGKRKLENMAATYGIPFDPESAHKADYDVEVTAKVTRAIIEKYGVPTTAQQAAWYEEWRSHLEEYFRKTDPTAVVERGWPLREGR